MLRYSLGSLFLALLYFSVGFAALANASGAWPHVAVTMTIAILVLVSLGAIFLRERGRVFAIGFSATGWLYFLLVFSSITNVRPYLLTETATTRLFMVMHGDQAGSYATVWSPGSGRIQRVAYQVPRVAPPLPAPPAAAGYYSPTPAYAAATVPARVDAYSFSNIGHSLWAVIVGFVGGVTAQILYIRSRRKGSVAEREERRRG